MMNISKVKESLKKDYRIDSTVMPRLLTRLAFYVLSGVGLVLASIGMFMDVLVFGEYTLGAKLTIYGLMLILAGSLIIMDKTYKYIKGQLVIKDN